MTRAMSEVFREIQMIRHRSESPVKSRRKAWEMVSERCMVSVRGHGERAGRKIA
jgi:hypothetical protein